MIYNNNKKDTTMNEQPNNCYEARLLLSLDNKNRRLIGTLDGLTISPVDLRPALEALETTTSMKYLPDSRSIVFENERSVKGIGPADYITSREILSGAVLTEIGGVNGFVDGGLASVNADADGDLQLNFTVPTPVEVGEASNGFLTYVADPLEGNSHYRTITPNAGASNDTVLIGHPDGSVEFAIPVSSPILWSLADLVGSGHYSGAPSVSGTTDTNYKYHELGTSQVITNTSGSRVMVTLSYRFSISAAASRLGTYATLVNGGSDYKTSFAEGASNIKTETGNGAQVDYKVVLDPNQRVQFKIGAWENQAGNIDVTIGSIDESGFTARSPVITIERII